MTTPDAAEAWARGTVARTMRRRQQVQAQGAIANDVLWRRGYPLPDGLQPAHLDPASCDHQAFGAHVEVSRLSATDDGQVTGYSADIRISCVECGLPFEFIGLPAGLSLACAMTSLAGDELRAPIRPMDPAVAALLRSEPPCSTEDTAGTEHHSHPANPGR